MSGPLAALERFFERLFERPAARLFGTGVEPVQVRHRLERAMDAADRGGMVPDFYLVRVHPDDLAGLGEWVPEFAGALLARAHQQGYRLPGRPVVELTADPRVAAGECSVDTGFRRAPGASPSDRAAQGEDGGPGWDGASGEAAEPGSSSLPGATMVFEVPVARVPYVALLVQTPGTTPREVNVEGPTMRIGRGTSNDLVLADGRVSREHGLVAARQGGLVYTDLDSTNGSFVNGTRVREVALGPGDVLRVGDSTITVTTKR